VGYKMKSRKQAESWPWPRKKIEALKKMAREDLPPELLSDGMYMGPPDWRPRERRPEEDVGLWTAERLNAWTEAYLSEDENRALVMAPFLRRSDVRGAILALVKDGFRIALLMNNCHLAILRLRDEQRARLLRIRIKEDQLKIFNHATALVGSLRALLETRWEMRPIPYGKGSKRFSVTEAVAMLEALARAFGPRPKSTWLQDVTFPIADGAKPRNAGSPFEEGANDTQATLTMMAKSHTNRPHHAQVGVIVSTIFGVARRSREATQRQYRRIIRRRRQRALSTSAAQSSARG
jgi:hypothetical protein